MGIQFVTGLLLVYLTVLLAGRLSARKTGAEVTLLTEYSSGVTSTLGSDVTLTKGWEVFKVATVADQLTVTAVVYSALRRQLQLHINWTVPTGGKAPVSFNLHITPVVVGLRPCVSDPFYTFISDPEARQWRVPPEYGPSVSHDNLHLLPGCSYNVSLESNPHNGKTSASALYTIPDCLGGVCSCFHWRALPQPRVRVTVLQEHTVNISWVLLNNDNYNITRIKVGLGKEMMRSSGGRVVYNTSWVKEVPVVRTRTFYHLLHSVPGPGLYLASVRVVDSRHCVGASGNFSFTVSDDTDHVVTGFTKDEVVWLTVLPCVSVVLAFCVALNKVWQRCFTCLRRRLVLHGFLHCLRSGPPQWTGVYKTVSVDSGRSSRIVHPSLQERNILYVDKEIDEAKQRGEADGYEVSYNRLALGRQIGKGAFGRVFLARIYCVPGTTASSAIVAVKKLKHKATVDEMEEFLAEIAMMKRVGRHPNIVTMVGCCTIKHPFCMVMEYVPCGDLLAYLRKLRSRHSQRFIPQQTSSGSRYSAASDSSYITPLPLMSGASTTLTSVRNSTASNVPLESAPLDYELDPRELHSFASQIAKGMAYLEDKQITHRDLAARNILIDEKKTLKISDFGLSRSGIYVNTRRRKVPLRWLSIEAMTDSLYSSKSDVWAFGVVLWEIGTLGGFPYPTVSDHDLLNYLVSGRRLDQPDNFSDELYTLMKVCWSQLVDDRPTFQEISFDLDSSPRRSVYVDFRPDHEFPPTEQQENVAVSASS